MSARRPGRRQNAPEHAGEPPGSSSNSPLRLALLLALVALIVRVVYLLESGDSPFRVQLDLDPQVYDTWARSILAGRLLGPGAFPQAPLFPYFVAGCYALLGAVPQHVLWIQAFLGSLTVLLGAWAAGRLWGRTALLATGLLLILYKPGIFYTGVLLAPVLATALLAGALFLMPRRPLLAGLVAGLSGLAHPLVLPAAAVALWGFAGKGATHTHPLRTRAVRLRILLGILLVILPVTVHNLAFSGKLIPISANTGVNLHIGNGPQATGFYAASQRDPQRARDLCGIGEAERLSGNALSPAEASRFWTQRTLDAVRENPGRVLGLFLRKLYFFLHAYEAPQLESLDFEKRYSTLLKIPILPNWMLLIALAAASLVLCWGDRRVRALALAVLATAVATALFFITGRFRFPIHLLLALLAGSGIARVLQLFGLRGASGRPRLTARRVATAAGLAAAAAYVLLYPNWFAIGREQTIGQYHHRVGVFAEREGNSDEARGSYAEALRLDPQIAPAAINLGILTARRGDLARAESLLLRGVELDSRSARGYLALGQIRQIRGETGPACSLYAQAWVADTTFLAGLEALATCTYLLGDVPRAAELSSELLERAGRDPVTARARFILDRLRGREEFRLRLWDSAARAEADLAFAARDLPRAAELYSHALEQNPDDLAARLELVYIAAARGDSAGAASLAAEFVRRGGNAAALAPAGVARP